MREAGDCILIAAAQFDAIQLSRHSNEEGRPKRSLGLDDLLLTPPSEGIPMKS